jgi:hypothetical protein
MGGILVRSALKQIAGPIGPAVRTVIRRPALVLRA